MHPDVPGVAYGTFTNNTARTTTDARQPARRQPLRSHPALAERRRRPRRRDVRLVGVRPRRRGPRNRRRLDHRPRRRLRLTRRPGVRRVRSAVDRDRRQPADRLQQPDAGRRPDDRRHPPVPRRPGGLRDHRLDDRPTTSARCSSTSSTPARAPSYGAPGAAVELARLRRPAPLGHPGHPPQRRRAVVGSS